jgi:hypothetical protein
VVEMGLISISDFYEYDGKMVLKITLLITFWIIFIVENCEGYGLEEVSKVTLLPVECGEEGGAALRSTGWHSI